MAQKSGLNRAILSVGWGSMAVMLGYKGVWYGAELRRVPPMGTSQQCSGCGHNRGLLSPTPEDPYSESACGALCARQGVEPGNEGRKAGSLAMHGEE